MDTIIIVSLFALIIDAIQNVIGHKVSLLEKKILLNARVVFKTYHILREY